MSTSTTEQVPLTEQETTPSGPSSPFSQKFHREVERVGIIRSKLEAMANLVGLRALQSHQQMNQLNQEAENRAVRKKLWGNDGGANGEGQAVNGTNILGDVTYPTPIVMQGGSQSQNGASSLLKTAGLLALGAGMPLAGVGGYLLSGLLQDKATPVVTPAPSDGETVDLGLGHIGDYLKDVSP